MRVFRGFSQSSPGPTALTIGNFDGVHLGHRALLGQIRARAERRGLLPAVMTFEPHPREYFCQDSAPPRLSTLREKLELIADEGIALSWVCRFDARLAQLDAQAFIEDLLVRSLQVRHLVVGDDFRFGAHRQGNFALLEDAGKMRGFEVEAIQSVMLDGTRVSSSAVRKALGEGRMEDAARLLGRPYVIDGRVVTGQRLGTQLGVPTANLRIKHSRTPLSGVFTVEVKGLPGGPRAGVANIGVRPSVGRANAPVLEVHLLDFSGDLYGAHLSVRFLHKIREEQKFPDLETLKRQIFQDIDSARQYFSH